MTTTTIEQQIRALFNVDGAPEWEVELLTPIQAEGETDHAYLTRCKRIAKERDNERKAEAKVRAQLERWADVRDAAYRALPDSLMPERDGYMPVSGIRDRESLISYLTGYGAYVRDLIDSYEQRMQAERTARDSAINSLRDAYSQLDRMQTERRAARAFFGIEVKDEQDEPSTPHSVAMECVRLFPGQKISAIKELRQRIAGLGLKEAKDLVDAVTNSTSLHG